MTCKSPNRQLPTSKKGQSPTVQVPTPNSQIPNVQFPNGFGDWSLEFELFGRWPLEVGHYPPDRSVPVCHRVAQPVGRYQPDERQNRDNHEVVLPGCALV